MSVKPKKEPPVEVVASGQALSVVAGWLGIGEDEAFDDASGAPPAALPPKRPAYLGLGAKFVPHHKAVGFAAALDDKLKKRLESARKRGAARAGEDEGEQHALNGGERAGKAARFTGGPSSVENGHHQQRRQQQQQQQQQQQYSDDEDEEDLGKARQVRQRPQALVAAPKGKQHHQHQQHQHGPAKQDDGDVDSGDDGAPGRATAAPPAVTMSSRAAREALLFGAGLGGGLQDHAGGKKKKKKKKKNLTPASGGGLVEQPH